MAEDGVKQNTCLEAEVSQGGGEEGRRRHCVESVSREDDCGSGKGTAHTSFVKGGGF